MEMSVVENEITLKVLEPLFVVCQVQEIESGLLNEPFVFIGKTDEEISVVCPVTSMPKDCIAVEEGWSALKIEGVLDFSLVGILAGISSVLAKQQISLFALSTFNTDYILVKQQVLMKTIETLENNGYRIMN